MLFEPNSFFRAYVRNVGKDIDHTQLRFSYANISYEQFMEIYGNIDCNRDHDAQTFTNPFPVVLELISHVAYGIFKGICGVFRGDVRPLVCTAFYVIRDSQEIVCRIFTLFSRNENRTFGIYLTEKNRFEKRCYDQFMAEGGSSKKTETIPTAPPGKEKFTFWLRCAERYYDSQEYVKAYEVIRCSGLNSQEIDNIQKEDFLEKLANKLFETEEYSLAGEAARLTMYGKTFLLKIAEQHIVENRYKKALEALGWINFSTIHSTSHIMLEQHRQLCLRIIEETLIAGDREIAKEAIDAIVSQDFLKLLYVKRLFDPIFMENFHINTDDVDLNAEDAHLNWISIWIGLRLYQPYTRKIINGLQAGASKEQINALLTAYVKEESTRLFEDSSFTSLVSGQSSYSSTLYRKYPVQAIAKDLMLPNEYQALYAKCKDENSKNYHKIFGLDPDWDKNNLSKAYRKLLFKLHADKHQGSQYYSDIVKLAQHINSVRDYLDPSKD